MEFSIRLFSNFSDRHNPLYQGFRKLHVEFFSEKYTGELEEELARKANCTLFIAHIGNEVLGFKLGYELGISEYYSWTGGVSPHARNRGVGSALMNTQHEWCQQQGYKRIQTKTKNQWRDMIILNLKHGFKIIGCYTDSLGEPKLILEKTFM